MLPPAEWRAPVTKPRRDFYWRVAGRWAGLVRMGVPELRIEVDHLARRAAQLSSSGGRAGTKWRMDSPSAFVTENK
jgi:hypothetical protein